MGAPLWPTDFVLTWAPAIEDSQVACNDLSINLCRQENSHKTLKVCGLVQDRQSKTKCYHLITGIVQMFLPAKIGRISVTLFALKSADRLHRSSHRRKALGRHGHLQRNQNRSGQCPDRLTILNTVSNDKFSVTKLI